LATAPNRFTTYRSQCLYIKSFFVFSVF